jgi:Tfp pilus assembly PilM family ATPase
VKTVEIDGSYKKTRLVRMAIERIAGAPPDGDGRIAITAATIAESLQQSRMSGDAVLGQPCREAVLRTIDVPFRGTEAIRKVIKSEVETAIHSHQVDDMVVDFHEVGGVDVGSRVLVAALPKHGLRTMLAALEAEGIEPEHVDLDTMALYRVADWCGAFTAPPSLRTDPTNGDADGDADSEPDDLPVPVDPLGADGLAAVLDLGSRSTRVLLVEGGRLVDMRTLRLGDATIAEALVRGHDLPFDAARDAVRACLVDRSDFEAEVTDADLPLPVESSPAAGAALPAAAPRRVRVKVADVEAEQAEFMRRLARELTRFLASSGRDRAVQALWITGGPCRMPGMREMLTEVFGTPPRELDVLGRIKHSLPPEEAEAAAPQVAIAIGLALANLGGPRGFDFRREDLAFTRGFDRIKFPLAITCMVALFAAVVYGVRLHNEFRNLEYRLGLTYESKDADPKNPRFYGELNPIVRMNTLSDDRFFKFREGNRMYGRADLLQDLLALPVADRIRFVRDKLRRALDLKQKESGIYEEVSLESGLAVLERFFEVLKRAEPGMGKYLLCSLDLSMRATPSTDVSGRYLQCKFAFRNDSFRECFAALRQAIEQECERPDSPFQKIDERSGEGGSFADYADKQVNGAYYTLKIHIKESFAPFGVGS